MLSWSCYNYLWFLIRGERRSQSESIVFNKDIARYFNVDAEHVRKLKTENRIEVTIDNNQIILPEANNPSIANKSQKPFKMSTKLSV